MTDPAELPDRWPTAEALAAVAPPDAAALTDAALRAVHRPLPLIRTSPTGSEPADERDALAALLVGPDVVWLVGPPGSGKTHLLRWLGLHAGDRLVVSVPGNTDLDAVVERVAAHLPEPPPAPRAVPDEKAAAAELLERFREALRDRTAAARAVCDAAAERGERPPADERAVAETHGDGLVALLAGPTKDSLFRDTPRRKSPFKALVRRVTTGTAEPDRERFEPADFEFTDVNSARLTDPKAQRYVAKLKTNLQGERAAAAALMNAARDAALAGVPAPDPAAPADPLARVREALAGDGRELALLVDDFTGTTGLLDALAATDGAGRCPVRVAVTAEAAPDGAEVVFRLGDEAALPGAVADFAAAYLTAAGGDGAFPLDLAALERLAGDGRLVPGRLLRDLPAALAEARDALAPVELPPEPAPAAAPPEPVPTPVEPVPVEPAPAEPAAPREVDPVLGALAVLLGRLPVPAPDDVVRFLVAAHTTGATLDVLTPGVLEWLTAHGQAAAFLVRPARHAGYPDAPVG